MFPASKTAPPPMQIPGYAPVELTIYILLFQITLNKKEQTAES